MAWLLIVSHAFLALIGGFVCVLLLGAGVAAQDPEASPIVAIGGMAVAGLRVLRGIPGLAAGVGLLARKTWGRVVATLNLLNSPFGTLIGAYALWVLLQDRMAEYMTGAGGASVLPIRHPEERPASSGFLMAGSTPVRSADMQESATTRTELGYRLGLAILLLACSVLIGFTGYLAALPSGTRALLRIGLPIAFLACTVILRWRQPAGKLWPAALAFFSISLGIYLARPVDAWRMQLPGLASTGTQQGMVAAKLAEALPVIVSILVLTRLAGASLGSLHLRRGKLGRGLVWGLLISLFTLVPYFAIGGPASLAGPGPARVMAALPWALAFAAVNAFYEELWFRGLLLGRFEPLLGGWGSLVVTSLAFAALHFASSYMGGAMVQLVAVTLALGLAYGYLVQKTGTLWGAVLAHTLADVMLLLPAFAAL